MWFQFFNVIFLIFQIFGILFLIRLSSSSAMFALMVLFLLYIYTRYNISLHYRTQRAISSILTAQVQAIISTLVTGIPQTERQRLKDDHLLTSLRFFKACHWRKDPMTKDRYFRWSSGPLCICLSLGSNPCPLCS